MTASVVAASRIPVRLVSAPGSEPVRAECVVDPDDPVFSGHYPGFPVLPGVYLIDLVGRAVDQWLAAGPADSAAAGTLVAVERCRFLRPVYASDTIAIELLVSRVDGELRSAATVRTAAGAVADIRLRHAPAHPPMATPPEPLPPGPAPAGSGGFGLDRITRTIPHRYPILLVDRVAEVVAGQRLTAVKAVTSAEPCYAAAGHTPDGAGADGEAGHGQGAAAAGYAYPVPLLIESWAQAAVLLAVWETPNPDVCAGKVELAGAINDIRVGGPVYPGSVVEHRVEIVKAIGDTSILAGRTLCDGRVVLEVNHFVLALRDISALAPEAGGEAARDTAEVRRAHS